MAFAGTNYLAIFVAAIAGWLAGAVWYGALFSKPWMAANNLTPETMKARGGAAALPFILSFLADLVMAWMLAGLLGHLGSGQVTLVNGIASAGFIWVGFVFTTLAVNNMFAGRKPALLWIDGGHWLAVLVVMGVVIGWWGVK
jgi:hypothetical protein